jgi:hypothetical protein
MRQTKLHTHIKQAKLKIHIKPSCFQTADKNTENAIKYRQTDRKENSE